MKIVGVAACPVGIAHTYMTKDCLTKAAKACGHECHIETRGSVGVEDALTTAEIERADIVVLACDVKVPGEERFQGKALVRVSTSSAIKDPVGLIKRIESALRT